VNLLQHHSGGASRRFQSAPAPEGR